MKGFALEPDSGSVLPYFSSTGFELKGAKLQHTPIAFIPYLIHVPDPPALLIHTMLVFRATPKRFEFGRGRASLGCKRLRGWRRKLYRAKACLQPVCAVIG